MRALMQMNQRVTWGNEPEALTVAYTLASAGRHWVVLRDEAGGYWAAEDEGDGNWSLLDEEGDSTDFDKAIDACREALERAND